MWSDYLSDDIVKVNVADGCSLVDFCQFRNENIDFVKLLTAFKGNAKIIIFTTCKLFTVFSLLTFLADG